MMNLTPREQAVLQDIMIVIENNFSLDQITNLTITSETFPSSTGLGGEIEDTTMTKVMVCVLQVGNVYTVFDEYGNGYELDQTEHPEMVTKIKTGTFPTQFALKASGHEDLCFNI